MARYTVISLICLGLFIAIFTAFMSGISFGPFNVVVEIAMYLLPFLGLVMGLLGENNFWKWIAVVHNLLMLGLIIFALIMTFVKGVA